MSNENPDEKKYADAYTFTAKWEGGLSSHPADSGGITNYGVSIVFLKDFTGSYPVTAKKLGLPKIINEAAIRSLTKLQAKEIFRVAFWNALNCDRYSPPFATAVFDAAVNSGPARSVRLAQTACNATGLAAYIGGERLLIDGALGPKSSKVFEYAGRDEALALIGERKKFLQSLCKNKPSQNVFYKGWLNRLNDLQDYILKLEY